MKRVFYIALVLTVIASVLLNVSVKLRDSWNEFAHSLFNSQEPVTRVEQIDEVLSSLTPLRYDDLDADYLAKTKSATTTYLPLLVDLQYYQLNREDFNTYIVGEFRLKEFVSRDASYKQCVLNKRDYIICAFDKKIFYKTLELKQALKTLGHDDCAFQIVNGHRHPQYNEQVGGAKMSRHIKGQAVDIVVGDINKDGRVGKNDKAIVLELLDKKIIGDKGGIGLYPGTDNVHYDVRGVRARWDSY